MRTYTHVIDTMAVKKTLNAIPDHWVVRELTERDYGIDLMVEIFEPAGTDKNGHSVYDSTGHVCYLQIKGTNNPLTINAAEETVSVSIPKKTLLYVEKFATPFLLVRVPTNTAAPTVYFGWMQRYILDRLGKDYPGWRNSNQESFTLYLPLSNTLPENKEKIEKIAARIKYIEEFTLYYEKYTLMKGAYHLMIDKTFSSEQYDLFIEDLKFIRELNTLLRYNDNQITRDDITQLIDYVLDVKIGTENPTDLKDFPEPLLDNMETLLSDNFMRNAMEEFKAENEGDTVY